MFTLTQGSQAGLLPVKGQCKRLCLDLFRVLVLSFFFWQHFLKSFQLKNYESYPDQTWSQSSMGDWLQKLSHFVTSNLTPGSQGSKKVKSKKSFNCSMIQGMVMKFWGMNGLDILHKSYRMTKICGVKWGHRGQNKRSNC